MQNRGDTIAALFGRKQYRVPIYQRRYVWSEENWNSLWKDIEEKFNLRRNEKPSIHFTGTIITREDKSRSISIPKYDIIDGQQRLTTFQIVLCVIRDICQKPGRDYGTTARNANKFIKNIGDEAIYKLCPKEGLDKNAFCALADSRQPLGTHIIHKAYENFEGKITNLVSGDPKKMVILYDTIINDFRMIQIDVKEWDDPEKIFAAFHVPGRILDEFDCLRNDLFLNAREDGERLYSYWSHFDTENYWAKQERLELFLRHFLEAKLGPNCFQKQNGREPKAFDVYQKRYRTKLRYNQDIEYEFAELKRYSEIYENIDTHPRMLFNKLFDIRGWHSFILFLLGEKKIEEGNLDQLFQILESYTMRRMLRYGLKFKSPNKDDFLPRIRKQISKSDSNGVETLVRLLYASEKPYQWPNDRMVISALRRPKDDFKENEDNLQYYVLYRSELLTRGKRVPKKSDLSFNPQKYIRKHIMPPTWHGSWVLPLGKSNRVYYRELFPEGYKDTSQGWIPPSEDDLKDQSPLYRKALNLAKHRTAVVDSIGNLTIVEQLLSSMPTNVDFSERKKHLSESSLKLNEEVCKQNNWDVPQILQRTEKMISRFLKIWPSAENFIEEIAGIPPRLKSDELIESTSYQFNVYSDGGTTEFVNLAGITTSQFRVEGTDPAGNTRELDKTHILFAFPATVMVRLKPHLKEIDKNVLKDSLPPAQLLDARRVSAGILKLDNYIRVVTRRGSVLCGVIEHFDRYCIHMQINGQTVIVYRHAVRDIELQFSSVKSDEMMRSESYICMTSTNNVELAKIKLTRQQVIGVGKDNRKKILIQTNILAACPAATWLSVKSQIETDEGALADAEDQKLKSTQKGIRQFRVQHWLLESAKENQTLAEATVTSGRVFRGTIEDFDEAAIYLKINAHTVIVFLHGLYKFTTKERFKRRVEKSKVHEFYGFVDFSEGPKRVYVNKSQVPDGNLGLIQQDQEVEFNISQTNKGLEATNVNLVKSSP